MGSATVSIDVISDVVCPWCYVGQKRLERALGDVPDVAAALSWRPFQLDATIPPGGVPRLDYLTRKFGDPRRIEDMHARLKAVGDAEGIDFNFDAIKVSPNTLDAHRLIRWAGSEGVQSALVRVLFRRYFEDGEDIGDHAILAEAAREAGMDGAVAAALLATDADRDAVSEEILTASRMGVTGVPCFVLDHKYAVMGAQDATALADAIRQVAGGEATPA